MFVVDQGSVDARAWLMVDGEVTPVGVPPEQVVLLFIYDQFLKRERQFQWIVLIETTGGQKWSANSLQCFCAPEP